MMNKKEPSYSNQYNIAVKYKLIPKLEQYNIINPMTVRISQLKI